MFSFGITGMATQEDQTVTFSPEFVDGPTPWFDRLFVLYLLFAIIIAVARSVALMWALRKHRKIQSPAAPLVLDSSSFWEGCHARTRSIRDFSHLTFLLSVLVFAMNGIDAMDAVATQKTAGVGAIAGATAGAFTTFSAGMIVCIALFCCAMFLERRVLRQRRLIDRNEIKPQLPDA
jgi:hypothetical protein